METMPSTTFSSPPTQNSSMQESFYRSPQMRKEALRNVYENAQALQSNVNTKTVENLEQIINEVDTINEEGSLEEKIQNQGEIYLDSEIMTISSHVLKKCTFSIQKNLSCYDPNEFAEKVRSYICRLPDTVPAADEEPDWTLMGSYVMKFFKRTPTYQALLGTLQPIPKKEIVRKKITRDAQAPVRRPENVISVDKVEDSERVIEEIQRIVKHYQKQNKKPLDFFALVLHPTDFGKTIENILHTSFLIRDGFIKFSIDENYVPQVQVPSKEELAEAKKKKKNIQNTLSLNMKQWRELVQAYNISKPMIDLTRNSNK